MTKESTGAFWTWSLERYERNSAAALLLSLQDDYGLNVNILMWCCWYAEQYGAAPYALIEKAVKSENKFNMKVTTRLRAARGWLKKAGDDLHADAKALRRLIKEAELKAEKIEQAQLEALAPRVVKAPEQHPLDAAKANLAAYAKLAKAPGESLMELPQILLDHSLTSQGADR